MKFLDSNHRIFSLPDYPEKPIGYEFEQQPYIFWFDKDNSSFLSVNNNYIKTIYCLLDLNDYYINSFDNLEDNSDSGNKTALDIKVTIDSGIFSFINTGMIEEYINKISDITDNISLLDDDDFNLNNLPTQKELSSENKDWKGQEDITLLYIEEDGKKYGLFPIYILANAYEEGTWTTNILIHVKNDYAETYCPITVGGEFKELYEELIINGQNQGVSLPKDILKAIYQESYYQESFNEELFNEKLKEYLLNFMKIRGNQGNTLSLLNSIKWFGYNNLLSIKTLFDIKNEYISQYFLTDFDIFNKNFLYSYRKFSQTIFINLYMNINDEVKDKLGNIIYNEQNIDNNNNQINFAGEGNPKMESILSKYTFVENYLGENPTYIDDNSNEQKTIDNIQYLKGIYNFSFTELGLKLALVKYYLNKYFLPLHIKIKNSLLRHKVYANDVKLYSTSSSAIQNGVICTEDTTVNINFPSTSKYCFHKQTRVIDRNFNEFDIAPYKNENKNTYNFLKFNNDYLLDDYYFICETCINIPIEFNTEKEEQYFDCIFQIEKKKETHDLYSYVYKQIDNNLFTVFDNLYILTKYNAYFNETTDETFAIAYNVNLENIYLQYYSSFNDIKKNILDNALYKHDLECINDNLYIDNSYLSNYYNEEHETYIIDLSNIDLQQIIVEGKTYVQTINDNINYYFSFVSSFILDENNEPAYLHPVLFIICEIDNEIKAYHIINLEKDDSIIYSIDNEFFTPLFNKYVLNINRYFDAIEENFKMKRMLKISLLPKFTISLKSNNNILEVYKVHEDELNKYIEDDNLLNELNIKTQSNKNIIKAILRNKFNDSIVSFDISDNSMTDLVFESHFNFVQNKNNIYKNFILCPKFLTNKEITYYQEGDFILKILCNNKWYYHPFTTYITRPSLDFGTLEYKYWDDTNRYSSNFSQLRYLSTNDNNKGLVFNSFMYNNRLVQVNNINFIDNIIARYNEENRIYIDLNDIPTSQTLYFIIVNGITIYLSDYIYSSKLNIKIPFKLNDNNIVAINENINSMIINGYNKFIIEFDKGIFKINNDEIDNDCITLVRNNESYIYTTNNNNKYTFNIYSNLNTLNLHNIYEDKIKLPNSLKYQNQVLLFDLKKRKEINIDILSYYKDIHLSYNGIMFETAYPNNNSDIDGEDTNKIIISGKLFEDKLNIENRYDKNKNTTDNSDIFSIITNKKPNNIDDNDIIDYLEKDGIQLLYNNDQSNDRFVYYIKESGEPSVSPYEKERIYIGYNIFNSREEVNKLFNLAKSEISIIDSNNQSNQYTIFKQFKDNKYKLYITINNIDYELYIEYILDTNNNYIKVNYSYIKLHYNVPIYLDKSQVAFDSFTDEENNTFYKYYTKKDDKIIYVNKIDYIVYKDTRNNKDIKNDPGMLWFSLDINEILNNSDNLNVNQKYNDLINSQNMISQANIVGSLYSIDDLKEIIDNKKIEEEQDINYINYLEYDFTKLKGKTFKFDYELSDNLNKYKFVQPVIELLYKDNRINIITEKGTIFELTDNIDEYNHSHELISAKLLFKLNMVELADKDLDTIGDLWFIPHLYIYSYDWEDFEYDSNLYNNTNILNYETESEIEELENATNNITDNLIDLYSKFFKTKYILFDKSDKTIKEIYNLSDSEIEELNKKLILSHIEEDNDTNISLDNDETLYKFEKHVVIEKDWCKLIRDEIDYDLYLMHDDKKWYCIYISKDTLGNLIDIDNIHIDKNYFLSHGGIMESPDGEFRLEYNNYSNHFLLNRYQYISKNGKNLFNRDDIICGYIANHDRLPINPDISNRWIIQKDIPKKNIKEVSLSKANMCILNVPKNNNIHNNGFYDVYLDYAIDKVSNQQFIYNGIIQIK